MPEPPQFPPASGVRHPWNEIPGEVRQALEERLGAEVVEAVTQVGGFSPGAAARLRLSDGRRVFAKAAGPVPNPQVPEIYRREAEVAAALPRDVPAPRFLFSFEAAEWVVIVLEDIDGQHPRLPWNARELRMVTDMVERLAVALTPTPLPDIPTLSDDAFSGFVELAGETKNRGALDDLDGWIRRHLDRLAAMESDWADAATGSTLLHTDIRADNVLLAKNQVYLIDWPHAAVGPAWGDLLFMLPSVAMQGGPDPWTIFDAHPVQSGSEPERVDTLLCGLAGFFVAEARKPAPPGLPTLRAFQQAQGQHAVRWLRHRTGWS
jgi:aminoglycoside phosphotransferase (APT) family kinase protein